MRYPGPVTAVHRLRDGWVVFGASWHIRWIERAGDMTSTTETAESLRDVRARAEAELQRFGSGWDAASRASVAVARDAIALTLSVERLLVRVRELTDERDRALRDGERLRMERIRLTHYDWTPKPGEELGDLLVLLNRGDWSVPWVRGAISGLWRRVQEAERALRIGDKLANAAKRLEQNPLANQLPRFRYPVQDAVAEWRDARAGLGGDGQQEPKEDTT